MDVEDYHIHYVQGREPVLIMAPHGGGIEPGTGEIASAVAFSEYSYYCFEGIKRSGNRDLHITSTQWREPVAEDALKRSTLVMAFHGCRGEEPLIYLGGLDLRLKETLSSHLQKEGFRVLDHPSFLGTDSRNLCNRGATGCGVQLELTHGLRRLMFRDLTREGRKHLTEVFCRFTACVRGAISESLATPP